MPVEPRPWKWSPGTLPVNRPWNLQRGCFVGKKIARASPVELPVGNSLPVEFAREVPKTPVNLPVEKTSCPWTRPWKNGMR